MPLPNLESRAPIDPAVVLPRAVREAAARSDELVAMLQPGAQIDPNAPPPTDPSLPTHPEPPPLDLGATPAPAVPGVDPAVVPTPAAQPTPAAPPAPEPGSAADWEHRFRSEKGRREVEARRFSDAMQEMQARMGEMERLLASGGRPAPPTPGAPVSAPNAPVWTDEERDTYGEDLLTLVDRIAERKLAPAMSRVDSVTTSFGADAREKMLAQLDQQIPTWKAVNLDPNFIAWLQLRDLASGATRLSLLTDAYEKNQTSRVAHFFNSFLAEASPEPTPGVQPTPDPAADLLNPPPSNRIPLASLAAPGRSGSAAAPNAPAPAKRTYTTSQIAQFYSDKTRGRHVGREVDANAMEQDIFAAQSEGRVIEG